MKLDRNITNPRRGKYALIKLRVDQPVEWIDGDIFQIKKEAVDFGDTMDSAFFVIRLKDKYAFEALRAYARSAAEDGEVEYAREIVQLAESARNHPHKRKPD